MAKSFGLAAGSQLWLSFRLSSWYAGTKKIYNFIDWPEHKVLSSVIAAWTDVSSVFAGSLPAVVSTGVSLNSLQSVASAALGLNIGYFWMIFNCLTSAAYVSAVPYFNADQTNFKYYSFYRYCPCGKRSRLPGSPTGTLCFTTIYSVFLFSRYYLLSAKTGVPIIWLEICEFVRELSNTNSGYWHSLALLPIVIFCWQLSLFPVPRLWGSPTQLLGVCGQRVVPHTGNWSSWFCLKLVK